jgi:glycosyltransferase involved in cell wall biosynthesis
LFPLVSIVVTTYNSGAYVIETLESIATQTWPSLELIVSDDCSTDNTAGICSQWLQENKNRFARVELITVPHNTGVSANCNRSIKAAKSEWVKFIAGDDILLPNCIEQNMMFAKANPDALVIFSQVHLYKDTFEQQNFMRAVPAEYPQNLMQANYSAVQQFQLLLLSDRINYTPSYFFNKAALQAVGGYDEDNVLVEDYPMWLKLTRAGFRLFYFHTATVGYRQHSKALNNMQQQGLFKPLLLKMLPLKKRYVYPYLPWDIVWADRYRIAVSQLFNGLSLNRNNKYCSTLYAVLSIYTNPFRYIIYFKKRTIAGKDNFLYANL